MAISIFNNDFCYWLRSVLIVAILSICLIQVGSATSNLAPSDLSTYSKITLSPVNEEKSFDKGDVGESAMEMNVTSPAPHASLKITSNPEGANIFFDGEKVGKTPMDIPVDDFRVHLIRLELNGYDIWEGKHNFDDFETEEISVSLNKTNNTTLPTEPIPSPEPKRAVPDFLGIKSSVLLLCGYLILRGNN